LLPACSSRIHLSWKPERRDANKRLDTLGSFNFCNVPLYHRNQLLLPPEAKKKRNKTNAQMMMAQFYIFIADTLFAVSVFVSFLPGNSIVPHSITGLGGFLKASDFGLVSFVHCLLVPEL
jgi:hypothetical protein